MIEASDLAVDFPVDEHFEPMMREWRLGRAGSNFAVHLTCMTRESHLEGQLHLLERRIVLGLGHKLSAAFASQFFVSRPADPRSSAGLLGAVDVLDPIGRHLPWGWFRLGGRFASAVPHC